MAEKKSGSSGDNPFRKALEPIVEPREIRPFSKGTTDPSNPVKAAELRTIADLRLVDAGVLQQSPKIAGLTVHDLNDLAAEFSGIPTENSRVADLTIEDIQDIEAVFMDFKLSAGRELSARAAAADRVSVDVSCCCCTPCCCCAATDMSHTA